MHSFIIIRAIVELYNNVNQLWRQTQKTCNWGKHVIICGLLIQSIYILSHIIVFVTCMYKGDGVAGYEAA